MGIQIFGKNRLRRLAVILASAVFVSQINVVSYGAETGHTGDSGTTVSGPIIHFTVPPRIADPGPETPDDQDTPHTQLPKGLFPATPTYAPIQTPIVDHVPVPATVPEPAPAAGKTDDQVPNPFINPTPYPAAEPTKAPAAIQEPVPDQKPVVTAVPTPTPTPTPAPAASSGSDKTGQEYINKEEELKKMGMPESMRNYVLSKFVDKTIKSIEIKDEDITVKQGEKLRIETIIKPDNANEELIWESEDESIIRFDEQGLAEGVKPGEAVVTVRAKSGAFAKCTVKCTDSDGAYSIDGQNSNEDKPDRQDETTSNISEASDRYGNANSSEQSGKPVRSLSLNSLSANDAAADAVSDNTLDAENESYIEMTADRAGDAIISMRFDDGGKAFTVTIGQSYAPKLVTNPEDATRDGLKWEIVGDKTKVSLDSSGNITGKSKGPTKLKVTAPNGATAVCDINVVAATPTDIDGLKVNGIKVTNIELIDGEEVTVTPSILPSTGVDDAGKIAIWRIGNPSIAQLASSEGITNTIKGINKGTQNLTTTLTVSLKNYGLVPPATCTVTVKPRIPATSITLIPEKTKIAIGEKINFRVLIEPAYANDTKLAWSRNAGVADVDTSLKTIKGTAKGTLNLTAYLASNTSVKGSCTVEVEPVAVTGIEITNPKPARLEIVGGETTGSVTAKIIPDNATNKNIRWTSSNENVATVTNTSTSGMPVTVTGREVQEDTTVTITATSEESGDTATCEVLVKKKVRVDGVSITPNPLTLKVDEQKTLTAVLSPSDPEPYNKNVRWSILEGNDVIRIAMSGADSRRCFVTGLISGNAIVRVTTNDGGHTADCPVTVEPLGVTGITLDKHEIEMDEADPASLIQTLTATITPEKASNKGVTWRVDDDSVVELSGDGLTRTVTGIKPGTAKVTVTTDEGGYTDECTITIKKKPVPVTGIEVDPTSKTIKPGETFTLNWHTLPEGADETTVTLSSNNAEIAAVEPVTGSGTGSATVKGGDVESTKETDIVVTTAEGHSAACHVTVKRIRVTDVSLSINEIDLYEGESQTLEATVLPTDADDTSVSWSSSSPSIADVDQTGKVTGVKEGTTAVTVLTNDGNKRDVCIVHVHKRGKDAEGIFITPSENRINIGQDFDLTATLIPEGTTDKKITWKSNDPTLLTVSGNHLTANAVGKTAGTAVITATTSNGKTAFCIVTIEGIPEPHYVEDVYLDQMFKTIYVGESFDLTPTVSPYNADDKTVTWESSKESIATVNNGRVTGLKKGEVTITVTTNGVTKNGEHKRATCIVTVKEEPEPPVTGPYKLYIADERSNPYRPDKVRGAVEALAGDRYLVILDSDGAVLKPLIKGDSSLAYTKALFYDMWIVDISGRPKNDFIKCTVRIPLPDDMDIHKGIVRVVSIQDGRLDKSVSSSVGEDDGVAYVSFTATHFTEYAILYNKNPKEDPKTKIVYRDVPVIQYRDVPAKPSEKPKSKQSSSSQTTTYYSQQAPTQQAPVQQMPWTNTRVLDSVPRTGDR